MNNLKWDRPTEISNRQPLDKSKSLDASESSPLTDEDEENRSASSGFVARTITKLKRLDHENEHGNCHTPIWRARSLDEAGLAMSSTCSYGGENMQQREQGSYVSTTEALHSSFDTALLEDDRTGIPTHDYSSIFRTHAHLSSKAYSTTSSPGTPHCPSDPAFADGDGDTDHDLSGRKHLLHQADIAADVETAELRQHRRVPGTVRKLARHSTAESACAGGNTPVRSKSQTALSASPTPWNLSVALDGASAVAGSTPSTVKRRRAPLHQRKSPLSRVPPTTPREPTLQFHRTTSQATPRLSMPSESPFVRVLAPTQQTPFTGSVFGAVKNYGGSAAPVASFSGNAGATLPAGWSQDQATATTPTRNKDAASGLFPASTIRSSKVYFTGTTAASTILETTVETESIGTSSPTATRFRFTTFPASLPRISNLRAPNRSCPDSVRKRMSFGDMETDYSTQDPVNQSKDDTNNTSISSLSADGTGTQNLERACAESSEIRPGGVVNGDTDCSGHSTFADPVHTKLFLDEAEYGYSTDDDSTTSPRYGTVSRTRLDFNVVLGNEGEGKKETSTKVVSKAESIVALPIDEDNMDLSRPYEQRRNYSFPSSTSSNTPLRNISGCDDIATTSTFGLTPSRSGGGSGPLETRIENHRPETPQEVQLHFQLTAAQCSPIPGVREEEMAEETEIPQPGSCALQDDISPLQTTLKPRKGLDVHEIESRLSTSQDSAVSSTSSTMRRLRPMPDMSAFENDAMSSSRNDRSFDESAGAESKVHISSPKLLCPPTPVRTPAWAHNDTGGIDRPASIFQRSNSLTATRVLATCSPMLLDRRCSMKVDHDSDDVKSGTTTKAWVDPRINYMVDVDELSDNCSQLPPGLSVPHEFFKTDVKPYVHPAQSNIKPHTLLPSNSSGEVGSVISFATDFQILGLLGSGAFADVYKVKSKLDNRLYAVKRNRRQFRGKRDRDMALAEVRSMQRLQSLCSAEGRNTYKMSCNMQYLLFFFRAWQEGGHFFCQTELCCRDTCRELMDSLRSRWNWARVRYPSLLRNIPVPNGVNIGSPSDNGGRLVPEMTIWKVCHDISAGLSQIHSHGIVHHDIKPSNIFFVPNDHLGALCKIGDFGMAADIGTYEDGQEGDQKYMAPELLTSGVKNANADIFSLGLTLYELASESFLELPSEGPRWHELRSGSHDLELPACRSPELVQLIQGMIHPNEQKRPDAETILRNLRVKEAGRGCDKFLRDYVQDIDDFDRKEAKKAEVNQLEDQTPRNGHCRVRVCSPIMGNMPPSAPNLFTPEAHT